VPDPGDASYEDNLDRAVGLAFYHPDKRCMLLADEVAELTRANLVNEHVPTRYTLHDLLRAYAAELAEAGEADERTAAVHRLLDHYAHAAHTGAMRLNPSRDPIPAMQIGPGVNPEALPDHQTALAWFASEHRVLLAAIECAAGLGLDNHTWRLSWALTDFLDRRGHWYDWVAAHTTALQATERLGERGNLALAHRSLARGLIKLRRHDEADPHLHRSLRIYRELNDPVGQARVHLDLSESLQQQNRMAEAVNHAELALTLSTAAGDRVGQARSLNDLGWCQSLLGNYEQALTYCTQAVSQLAQAGDRRREANAWDGLGYAHQKLGHNKQACTCYHQSLRLYRDLGDRYAEATVLTGLGEAHHAADDPDSARDAWQQALKILSELDHPDAEGVRRKLHPIHHRMAGSDR